MNAIPYTNKPNNSQNLIKLLMIKHSRFNASKLSVMISMGWGHVVNTDTCCKTFSDNGILYFGLFFSLGSFKSVFLFNERFNECIG